MNPAEAAARNLADLLFLIQDYDQALQIYKMSSNDFKVFFSKILQSLKKSKIERNLQKIL